MKDGNRPAPPEMGDNAKGQQKRGDRRGMRRGGPQNLFKDGPIDLSKLPEGMPEFMAKDLKAADKDGDGKVTQDEFTTYMKAKFGERQGQRPGPGGQRQGGPRQGGQRPAPPQGGNGPAPEAPAEK